MKNQYDVIVVGGGPSGSAAAIAAGRAGASVLVIENQNCLGGMSTSGFVNPLFDYANKQGLLKEIIDDLKAHDAWGGFWNMSFTYEYMKLLLEQKCLDAGATLLYDTRCLSAICEGNRVTGVRVANIDGVTEYFGKVIIDSTGDASVAADAGADWEYGDENGSVQAWTLMYLVGGVPEKYQKGLMIYELLEKAYEKQNEGKTSPFKVPYMIPAPNSRFAVLQLTHMRGYSALSAAERTQAVIEGRRQVIETFEVLKKFDPDFAQLDLISSAPMLGIRESRRIVGEYCLNEQDLAEGRQFDDAVCDVTFGVDIHNSDCTKQTCFGVKAYQIPYRCMIPKKLEGMLVAGKAISGTHIAMASYRVTGNCNAMGEAAGKAAAYAAKHDVGVREVPVDVYRLK